MRKPILEVKNLHLSFSLAQGTLHAVRGIDFSLYPKETVGIVGESGCGKSAALKALTQLNPPHTTLRGGTILYGGEDLNLYSEKRMRHIRGKEMGMIFQDPMSSLNPTMKIGKQIMEGYQQHFPSSSRAERRRVALEMLQKVGLASSEACFDAFAHTLSGGMRQRVMIALALCCRPTILLADEPTTALDVTIQAQILNLLKSIQVQMGMSMLLITHDMGVIASICDRVLVMYAGQIIESAPVKSLFSSPQHPYTRRLLAAIPKLDQSKAEPLLSIEGTPPNLFYHPCGCSFSPRCEESVPQCAKQHPPLVELSCGHFGACFKRSDT